ncbi:MAG TPA: hypothetical protein VEP90_01485 [Methylomirabilota bacterium]|nr:hypothetical protein [Methylomirabilota bacterium]
MLKENIKIGEIVGWRCWEVVYYPSFKDQPSNSLILEGYPVIEQYQLRHSECSNQMQYIWLRSFINIRILWNPKVPINCDFPSDAWYWGVHAFNNPEFLSRYLRIQDVTSRPNLLIAMGTVELWGTVFEHKKGWRGEFGAIRSIDGFWDYDNPQLLETLRKKYDVKEMENVK